MKKILIITLFLFTGTIFAQQDTIISSVQREEAHKLILEHVYKSFRVPHQAYNDSISRISYRIQFVIDENGEVTEPEIVSKNTECRACEIEIMRVMKSAPTVSPIILDNRKVKAIFILPFSIIIQ